MIRVKLLVRAGIALANALAAWWAWRTKPMEANSQPREQTEPGQLPRQELPPEPLKPVNPDEIDTDIDPEQPGVEQQFSND